MSDVNTQTQHLYRNALINVATARRRYILNTAARGPTEHEARLFKAQRKGMKAPTAPTLEPTPDVTEAI